MHIVLIPVALVFAVFGMLASTEGENIYLGLLAFSGAAFLVWITIRISRRESMISSGMYVDKEPKSGFLNGFLFGMAAPIVVGFVAFVGGVSGWWSLELLVMFMFGGGLILGPLPIATGVLWHMVTKTAKPKRKEPLPHNIGNYQARARKLIEERRRKDEAVVRADFMRDHEYKGRENTKPLSAYSELFREPPKEPWVVLDKDGLDATRPASQQRRAPAEQPAS